MQSEYAAVHMLHVRTCSVTKRAGAPLYLATSLCVPTMQESLLLLLLLLLLLCP
jgi:hypothetical protein